MRLLIISGRSGSGKTITLNLLEDLGYYCIDNLPVELLPTVVKNVQKSQPYLAISIDSRNFPKEVSQLKLVIDELRTIHLNLEIIYLEASQNILLRRFSETRRKHPLSNQNCTLPEAIAKECDLLEPLAALADVCIDTSHLSRQQLAAQIRNHVSPESTQGLQLLVQSFGFKNGIPPDVDFIFDVRCLPNPYWEKQLRNLTGLDKEVVDFLRNLPDVKLMVEDILRFLDNWIPRFEEFNRCYLTIGIGCTGGQHRSVYIAEELAHFAKKFHLHTQTRHRDLNKT